VSFLDVAAESVSGGQTGLTILRGGMPYLEAVLERFLNECQCDSEIVHQAGAAFLEAYTELIAPGEETSWAVGRPALAECAVAVDCFSSALESTQGLIPPEHNYASIREAVYFGYVHPRTQASLKRLGYERRVLKGGVATHC
jgi:hypothetical protein